MLGISLFSLKSVFTNHVFEPGRMCLCAQAKDHNDVSIKDLPNVGSSSFRAVLDAKEHQSCDLGKKGLGFSG